MIEWYWLLLTLPAFAFGLGYGARMEDNYWASHAGNSAVHHKDSFYYVQKEGT